MIFMSSKILQQFYRRKKILALLNRITKRVLDLAGQPIRAAISRKTHVPMVRFFP